MGIKNVEIDYEKQAFDELDINSYELVIAVSKKAREINEKAQKYLGSATVIKPVNLALKKIEDHQAKFVYLDEKNTSS